MIKVMTKEIAIHNLYALKLRSKSLSDRDALDMAIKALEQHPCEGMRDATEEERKSTKDYIDSISKPTGLQFDDIYEELDFVQPHKKISVNLQPCEDAISREVVKDMLTAEWTKYMPMELDINLSFVLDKISELPSVTPSYNSVKTELKSSEDCISREQAIDKMQELEDEDIKAYGCEIPEGFDGKRAVRALKSLPSVTPTRPHGEWIHFTDDFKDYAACSCCGYGEEGEVLLEDKTPFCPVCGADMREGEE